MPLADAVLSLPLELERYELERRESALSPEFTRVTTTVVLHGRGERGEGEDVTYASEDHEGFPTGLPLAGSWTLGDFSAALDRHDLFGHELRRGDFRDYRRWAFESAALDLALRQAGRSLGDVLGRAYRPVRFVASTRGDAFAWLAANPGLELKLDPGPEWERAFMERLAATGRVRVLDLKGYYRGTIVDNPPDPALYRTVAEVFPDAVIEDAWLEDGCRDALAGAEQRLSFDAPIHSLADLDALPLEPRWLNIKPSRFGTIARLLECIEACEARGIRMYGGGQVELGRGRRHIQVLASLFYADNPNDTAPSVYNEGGPRPGLPASPLPPPEAIGF
jgi:L-alanine-DL-glutamate epimerase-like enolase superfamily enzyme